VFRAKWAAWRRPRRRHEGSRFRQEDVPQLQDHPPQGRGARDLHGPASQATSRL